jgi:hypothetical protein
MSASGQAALCELAVAVRQSYGFPEMMRTSMPDSVLIHRCRMRKLRALAT